MTGTASGIARSLRIYYRDPGRARRMDALAARFVPCGGLAFDVGAHVGDQTASFRRLGARVVAVEPQPAAMRALRLIHGRDVGVTLVPAAAGARPGRAQLHLNTRNPTVSSLSPAFVAAAVGAPRWEDQVWDAATEVPVVTLDSLVARHGAPDFVKIDVEGYEDRVLAGLSTPLSAFSFEFTTHCREIALRCVAILEGLAPYEFNVSLGETHELVLPGWGEADFARAWLEAVPAEANSGDVYARLRR